MIEKEDEKIQSKKLKNDMDFIPFNLLINTILKETDIKKEIVEEEYSELFYETLNGFGTAVFENLKYKGNLKNGILDSRMEKKINKETEDKPNSQNNDILFENYNEFNNMDNIETISELYFEDGTIYKGTIHNNIIEGYGTFFFPTGSKYTGELKKGLRDGKGIYENKNSNIYYEGEWKNGLKHGKGILKKENMIYDGEWEKGIINGYGNIKWLKTNNFYEGNFKNSLLDGNGCMIWNDVNEKYLGQWENNFQSGIGVHLYYENKGEFKMLRNRYFGEWKNGKRNGFGIFYYSNGSFYKGLWENDKKNGFGIMNFIDRTQFIGMFENDKMMTSIENLNCEIFSSDTNNNAINSSVSTFSKKDIGNKSISKKTSQSILFRKSSSVKTIFEKKTEKIKNNDNQNLNEVVSLKEKLILEKINTPKLYLDISDIILLNPEIKDQLITLDHILLRNLTDIFHWYNLIIGKENIKDIEFGTSFATMTNNEAKSISSIQTPKVPINNLVNINKESEEKNKENNLVNMDYDLNNDLKFCMELNQLWLFLRDTIGIIDIDFTIVDFDRIFFNGSKNYIEMFYIPPDINNNNKEIYKFLYETLNKEKHDFKSNYFQYIHCQQPKIFEQGKRIIKDIHNKKNIILQRTFHEIFIRIAYFRNILRIKNENEILLFKTNYNMNIMNKTNLSLIESTKNLLSYIKPFCVNKKRVNSSKTDLSGLTSRTQNLNSIKKDFEQFLNYYESTLFKMFNKLYLLSTNHPNHSDKTVTYNFLYKKILLKVKDEKLLKIFKYRSDFCEMILSIPTKCIIPQVMTIGKKTFVIVKEDEKSINSLKESSDTNLAKKYLKLLNNEFNSYEFYELLFHICKRYSEYNNSFSKDFSFNQVIISLYEIIQKYINEEKENKEKGIYKKKYFYPKLKSHIILEEIIEAKRREEEERKIREDENKRIMKERENLKNEDNNVFIEKGENDSDEYDDDNY